MTEENSISILIEEMNSDYDNEFGFKNHPLENDSVRLVLDGEETKVKLVKDIVHSIMDSEDQDQINELKVKIIQVLKIFGFSIDNSSGPKTKKKKLDTSNVYLKILKHNKIKDGEK